MSQNRGDLEQRVRNKEQRVRKQNVEDRIKNKFNFLIVFQTSPPFGHLSLIKERKELRIVI
jgi:hypothetical protein